MNRKDNKTDTPAECRVDDSVSPELLPPIDLEDQIVKRLVSAGLIRNTGMQESRKVFRPSRIAVAWSGLAVCSFVAGLWVGTLLGQRTDSNPQTTVESNASTNAESSDLYALLLVNTEGYEEAIGNDQITRYSEYADWISSTQQRGLFVMGRELDAGSGWNVASSTNSIVITESSLAKSAPLSGIFLVRASNVEEALNLASQVPLIRHGGQVHVKRVAQSGNDVEPIVE